MKRMLNFGVSDPLTLGMAHPVADRLETLGRARPATWHSRCLALSAMSVIAISTAPITMAASVTKVKSAHTLSVIPDMSETQIADLRTRLAKLSSGQSDKSIITEFMMENSSRFVARYDSEDKIIDLKFGVSIPAAKEVLDAMPGLLERCKAETVDRLYVMRTRFSWGSANVQCVALAVEKRSAGDDAR